MDQHQRARGNKCSTRMMAATYFACISNTGKFSGQGMEQRPSWRRWGSSIAQQQLQRPQQVLILFALVYVSKLLYVCWQVFLAQ